MADEKGQGKLKAPVRCPCCGRMSLTESNSKGAYQERVCEECKKKDRKLLEE